MSWYDSSWKYRAAIAVDNLAGGAGTSDVTVTIPPDWDEFWTKVLSTGIDVRIAAANGRQDLGFERITWTYATKTGVFEIINATVAAAAFNGIWIYWGNSAAADASAPFAPGALLNGYILPASPGVPQVAVLPEIPGATQPRNKVVKKSSEALRIWWDFRALLHRRAGVQAGSRLYEEIQSVDLVDVQLATVSQAGMITTANTRIHDGWVSTWVRGGTSGTTYTAICRIGTSFARVLDARVRVYVKDVAE